MNMTPPFFSPDAASVENGFDALTALSLIELQQVWLQVFASAAPANFKPEMLARAIAWRAQANERGDLSAPVLCDLAMRASQVAGSRVAAVNLVEKPLASVSLKSGTRLVRTWQGETHAVDVAEGAFFWRGERYRSLSSVARAITGKHWNGPLFFGLRDRRDWERSAERRRGKPPARQRRSHLVKEAGHG